MNMDGSGRERIYSFESDATVEDVALSGKDGLYFVTKKLGTSKSGSGTYTTTSDRQLICLNLKTGKAKSVCSLDFGDGMTWEIIGSAGEKIILKVYQYPDNMTEKDVAALDENNYLDLLKKKPDCLCFFGTFYWRKRRRCILNRPKAIPTLKRSWMGVCMSPMSQVRIL